MCALSLSLCSLERQYLSREAKFPKSKPVLCPWTDARVQLFCSHLNKAHVAGTGLQAGFELEASFFFFEKKFKRCEVPVTVLVLMDKGNSRGIRAALASSVPATDPHMQARPPRPGSLSVGHLMAGKRWLLLLPVPSCLCGPYNSAVPSTGSVALEHWLLL